MRNKFFSYRAVLSAAIISGCFSLLVGSLIVIDFVNREADTPVDTPQYVALRQQWIDDPTNVALEEEIRDLDLKLRKKYFRNRDFSRRGAIIMLYGILATLLFGKWAADLKRLIPSPTVKPPGPDEDEKLSRHGLIALAALAAGIVLVVVVMRQKDERLLPTTLTHARSTTESESDLGTAAAIPSSRVVVDDIPAPEVYARSWPRFRGPDGSGRSIHRQIPTHWDLESGEHVLWRTDLDLLPGNGSPIVFGEQVFLSGADKASCEVYCFDLSTGQLVWRREVEGRPASGDVELFADTGFAASTQATDGRRVYSIFADGTLVAFDFEGVQVWLKSLGVPQNSYGHASSLAVDQGQLYVQWDQGDEDDDLSKLYCFDGPTGDLVWDTPRPVSKSWTTPLVVELDSRRQVICIADPWAIGYAVTDGAEIWRVRCMEGTDGGASPVYENGLVFAGNDGDDLIAFQPTGSGDITEEAVRWRTDWGIPNICSPLVFQEWLLLVDSFGMLTCYDKVAGGEALWEHDLGTEFSSSPSSAEGRVYLFGDGGQVVIGTPAAEGFEIVSEQDLGERCVASPAFQPGRIIVRGVDHLFCFGTETVDEAVNPDQAGDDSRGGGASVAMAAPLDVAPLPDLPPPETFQTNWPSFRGLEGNGISEADQVVDGWDTLDEALWKTVIDLPGANSPIVWDDRLFLTGADPDQPAVRSVFCLSSATGELLWKTSIPSSTGDQVVKTSEATGLAAPTMATDGRLAYAIFPNGDLVALTFDGHVRWQKTLGLPENHYGHASSLAIATNGVLVVQWDQGRAKDKLSKLVAFDGATGELKWEAARDVPESWCSPVIISDGEKMQVIAAGDPFVAGYDLENGDEIWRVDCLKNAEVGPTPVYNENELFVTNDGADLSCIRLGGLGDVTESNIVWSSDWGGFPDICSLLATPDFVLSLDSYGLLSCFDRREGGEPLWEEDFLTDFNASPILVGDRAYLLGMDGDLYVIKPEREKCVRVRTSKLNETCVASPAVSQNRLFIRTAKHLYSFGMKADKASSTQRHNSREPIPPGANHADQSLQAPPVAQPKSRFLASRLRSERGETSAAKISSDE